MIEETLSVYKPPPSAANEHSAKAARAEREETLSFEEVLERKKKSARAIHDEADPNSTVPMIAPQRQLAQAETPAGTADGQEPAPTAAAALAPAAQQTQPASGPVLQDFAETLAAAAPAGEAPLDGEGTTAAPQAGPAAVPQAAAGEPGPAVAPGALAPADAAVAAPTAAAAPGLAPEPAPELAPAPAAPQAQESAELAPVPAQTVEREPAPARVTAPLESSADNSAVQAQAAASSSGSPAANRPEMTPASTTVSEPARSAEASQELLNQVAQNIHVAASRNGTTMRVHLNPHELGSIDIRLVSNQNGVGIMVLAEKAATSHLLESQMAQLQQAVLNAGVQVAQLWVGQNHQPGAQASLFTQAGGGFGGEGGAQQGSHLPGGGAKGSGQPGQPKKSARYSVIDYRA